MIHTHAVYSLYIYIYIYIVTKVSLDCVDLELKSLITQVFVELKSAMYVCHGNAKDGRNLYL